MPAKVLDINDPTIPFPEFLILDASLILELHPTSASTNTNHALAVNFLSRLKLATKQGLVKPLLPFPAFEECYFKICRFILTGYARIAGGLKWHEYYKQNPRIIQSIHPLLVQLYQLLLAFPIDIIEPEDLAIFPKGRVPLLSARMGELIYQFSILPQDAAIFSEAERLGVYTVATLDSDWLRADGFTVFAPP